MSSLSSARDEVVCLRLGFGSYELGVGECRELIRFLDPRREPSERNPASLLAHRLEALLDGRAGIQPGDVTEEELDAVADAAWEWLQRAGPDRFPERVLLLLDVVRARHARD